jgi:hypothetical protein
MGLYAGVDYNLTLCPLQSRLQHNYHGQPYARTDLINPMSESTLCLYPLVMDFGFGLGKRTGSLSGQLLPGLRIYSRFSKTVYVDPRELPF